MLRVIFLMFLAVFLSKVEAKISEATYFYRSDRPLIIAHRGSPISFPEHSIGGFEDAYTRGADFLELDLEVTKDGHFVVFHDKYLDAATNIFDE